MRGISLELSRDRSVPAARAGGDIDRVVVRVVVVRGIVSLLLGLVLGLVMMVDA